MSASRLSVSVVCLLGAACGPSGELERITNSGPLDGPFYVSSEFSPSGHMGDGQEPGHITADINEHCKERLEGAGGDCYRFSYLPGEKLWAGVYWVYPANSWGSRPGRDLLGKYARVRFQVATEQDELKPSFIAGGINDPEQHFKDSFKAQIGSNIGRDWQQLILDLSLEPNISSVIGAFAFVTNYPAGSDPKALAPTVLYLDDIVWE